MRIAKLAGLLGCLWAGGAACGTSAGGWPPDAREAFPASDLPDAVAFSVEAIQPGGTTTAVERVWRDGEAGFLVTKSYDVGDASHSRSVWLREDGEVIERTHEIGIDEAHEAAVAAVDALGEGSVAMVEVVQRGPDGERYRFRITRPDGTRSVVECSLAGTDVRRLCWPR